MVTKVSEEIEIKNNSNRVKLVNNMEEKDEIEKRMIDDEYSSDLGGCLSLFLYIAVAIGILGSIYLFT